MSAQPSPQSQLARCLKHPIAHLELERLVLLNVRVCQDVQPQHPVIQLPTPLRKGQGIA